MTQWPFGSLLPEESGIRRIPFLSNSKLIILFCIGNYYVAVSESAKMLNSIGYKLHKSIVKNKPLEYCLLSASIPFDNIFTKLKQSHIISTKLI